jgi:hypothetical protein
LQLSFLSLPITFSTSVITLIFGGRGDGVLKREGVTFYLNASIVRTKDVGGERGCREND